ncbi:hypothetical protein A3B57_00020 [Microgenomates group bacterium RIFCSPLOWO2_01_FULL_47_10]|nr:MAG: hypothetical protein A3B57_00020 [Microgenomates group bacterium RIFCSPLOWO2_01_FULL_47_10]
MPISADFSISVTLKTIHHASGTTVYTMNELYSWLMDYFDDSTTVDDTVPMTAQTATQYTLVNGWFLNDYYYASSHFLTGGALKTLGFDADVYSYGIRVLIFNSGGYVSAVVGDIGRQVGYSGGAPTDTGTLLDFDNTARKWIVRVDDIGDVFSNTGTAIDLDNGTGTGAGTLTSASTTGENIWTNIYTIGTLVDNTQIYVLRDDVKLTAWWGMGHIDVLVLVQEAGTLIDDGKLTILARQYTTLYDHYLSDFSLGARTPVPLAAFADGNNETGYQQMVLSTTNDAFVAGDLIQDDSDSTIQGVVTSYVAGTNTLQYYLTGASLTNFGAGTGTFASVAPGTGTGTAVAPTDIGPAGFTGITFDFGATSEDLSNGNGARPYDCIIDVNSYSLADLYEYLKWVTRYGSSTSLNSYTGEQYTAVGEIRLPYDGQTTAFVEGETINGQTSGATAVIVSDHDAGSDGALILIEVTGTFTNNENLRSGATVRAVADIPSGAEAIAPSKQSPFGTFAGGSFFGARGVWLVNYLVGEANNFELIDSEGVTQAPPQTITISVAPTVSGDKVAVFPTTGDNEIIDKNQYTSTNANDSGIGFFYVLETIETDTPSAGYIRVPIRVGGVITGEDRYQYSIWTGSTFTLVGTLSRDYDDNDTAYVPYMDTVASGATTSQNITYSADRYVLTVVRIAGMVPYKITGQITTGGLSVPVVRTTDSVYQ